MLVSGFNGKSGPYALKMTENGVPCDPVVTCPGPTCPADVNGDGEVGIGGDVRTGRCASSCGVGAFAIILLAL